MHTQMIRNLPLRITVSLHRLFDPLVPVAHILKDARTKELPKAGPVAIALDPTRRTPPRSNSRTGLPLRVVKSWFYSTSASKNRISTDNGVLKLLQSCRYTTEGSTFSSSFKSRVRPEEMSLDKALLGSS